jgi:uncharacterized membrane protein YesL
MALHWTPEDESPLPEPPFFRKLGEDLWEGYFTLFVWTLVMWALCIPMIISSAIAVPLGVLVAALTLAPALTGLMTACGNAARGGFARLSDVAHGAFHFYWRSVLLALPLAVFIALILITTDVIAAAPERQEMFISWTLQIGLGLMVAVVTIYSLPVLALYDTPLKRTVWLAIALVGKYIWQTVALIVLAVALVALTALHPLVWLIVPSIWCVVVMNATWRLTRDWKIN